MEDTHDKSVDEIVKVKYLLLLLVVFIVHETNSYKYKRKRKEVKGPVSVPPVYHSRVVTLHSLSLTVEVGFHQFSPTRKRCENEKELVNRLDPLGHLLRP